MNDARFFTSTRPAGRPSLFADDTPVKLLTTETGKSASRLKRRNENWRVVTVRSTGDGLDDGTERRRGSTEERAVAIDPRIVVTP